MSDDGEFAIYVRPCAECGQQVVTSSLCVRPDLCLSCFAATVTSPKEGER